MVLRRLRHPGEQALAVCALELEREKDAARYGTWPFEIGLWVGKAATPNRMVRHTVRARLVRIASERRRAARAAHRLRELRVRVHARSRASHRRRGRVDLPPAPGVPDRDRGQVRLASLGRAGRIAPRRRRPPRCGGLLRGGRAGQGRAACGSAAAARPRDPGRAAPDLGAPRHPGGPLRGGDRGALRAGDGRPEGPPQDRGLDRDRAAPLRPRAGAEIPAPALARRAGHERGPGRARRALRVPGSPGASTRRRSWSGTPSAPAAAPGPGSAGTPRRTATSRAACSCARRPTRISPRW
jgi:hypothetical protein